MNMVWLFFAGLVGGVLGGMGFGGGMLLIPILTFVFGVSYSLAAWVNLVVFLPTAMIALILHCQQGMVEWRAVGYMLLFSFVGVGLGVTLCDRIPEPLIRRAFGVFLICIGLISIIAALCGYFKKNNKK